MLWMILYHFQLWELKMKTAYEQGRLMLLQNLDPSLSSSEVQVISIPNFLWITWRTRIQIQHKRTI